MGKAQSFNEYTMIQSAIIETRRKIEARNDSIERQRELLLAQEDTLKREKMMEHIESEKKSIERDKKLLKSLEEKAEKTAKKGNLSDEDRHKAQNLANKGIEKATEKGEAEAGKTQTGYDRAKNDINKSKKTNADASDGKRASQKEGNDANKIAGDAKERKGTSEKERNEDRKANNGEKEKKGTSEKEKGELEEKIRNAKRTSPEKFPLKNKRDLSLEIADARERLHIAEDHFKNSLNTQGQNAFVRTKREE